MSNRPERPFLLSAVLKPGQKVEMTADLGNLLLGDVIRFKSMGNETPPSIDIVTNYWVHTEPGKGGFLGIGGGKGKKTRQPLVFSFADSRLEKELRVNGKEQLLQKIENSDGQVVVQDSGVIQLKIIANYADPGPPPGGGYRREGADTHRAPQPIRLKIEILRQE